MSIGDSGGYGPARREPLRTPTYAPDRLEAIRLPIEQATGLLSRFMARVHTQVEEGEITLAQGKQKVDDLLEGVQALVDSEVPIG